MPKTLWLPEGKEICSQGGALVHYDYDSLQSSFTQPSAGDGTFYDCGLELIYTPPVDVVAIFYSKVGMSINNVTGVTRLRSQIYSDTASVVLSSGGFPPYAINTYYYEALQTIPLQLQAGVEYTLSVKVCHNGGSSPTIVVFGSSGDITVSILGILAWKE